MKKKGEWIVKVVTKWRLNGANCEVRRPTKRCASYSVQPRCRSTPASQAAQHSHYLPLPSPKKSETLPLRRRLNLSENRSLCRAYRAGDLPTRLSEKTGKLSLLSSFEDDEVAPRTPEIPTTGWGWLEEGYLLVSLIFTPTM